MNESQRINAEVRKYKKILRSLGYAKVKIYHDGLENMMQLWEQTDHPNGVNWGHWGSIYSDGRVTRNDGGHEVTLFFS